MGETIMTARAFREALPQALRSRLPDPLRAFQHRARFTLVQIWYGAPEFHYEVWPQRKRGLIEIGLHFEHRTPERNRAMHDFFDRHLIEIWHELGEIWLERWDRGWHKLYVTRPFTAYSQESLAVTRDELARQITVLQPFLEMALQRS